MASWRVLVVDDEPGMLEVCVDTLGSLPGVEVCTEQDSERAAERISSDHWDLLILDVRMPGVDGVELLRRARQWDPGLAALMITAYPSVDTAVETMKLGAVDYIRKPFRPEDLRATVVGLREQKRVREEHRLLARQVEGVQRVGDMVARSAPMREACATIQEIAPTDLDVLILGETGTGKELAARTIHRLSERHEERFVPVDCGALPEELLESEFFGHERGAFSGANTRSLGLLEYAHRGTVFLDEIGHLPPKLQKKLLRALQERRLRRVGANDEIEVDVRVVAATSLDLEAEVRKGQFASELYYRINVGRVLLPPLRERVADVAPLVEHLIGRYGPELGREDASFTSETLEVLRNYDWPGNIRELQNTIRRVLVHGPGNRIEVDDLPDDIVTAARERSGAGRGDFHTLREQHLAEFERRYLQDLLLSHEGDVSTAAKAAGIPRGTLYRFLKKHDVTPASFRAS